ncbi:MATE family efflux transporter [Ihubacter sp. rT4E-8]|uniref:MATE family efflux transporter n=1 Tax=Ihubacter sp. rT4E-8 TaxID=3242369 RepID=UPI003CF9D085
MRIQLSEHFTYKKLFLFVLPSIVMMIFTSIYSIIDGLFVSNFVGKTAFAAVNLIMPIFGALSAIGFMLGTGGSAIVAKTLGEKKQDLANQYFSMLIYALIIGGVTISLVAQIFVRPISILLGAEGELLEYCVLYCRIMLISLPCFMLQCAFQTFFVAAEKQKLGLYVSIISGVLNMVFDFLFIAVFHWGIAGAAIATAIGEIFGGIFPIVYFTRKNNSLLALTRTKFYPKALLKACTNGSSELLSSLSSSLVGALYNLQLLKFAGENGVAAYGTIMYVNFIFAAIYLGYSMGCAPIVSYNYGAENYAELKNLFKKSVRAIVCTGVILVAMAQLLTVPLAAIFVGYDKELFSMTCGGFRICAMSFLICGINIFGSSFFTALNNGLLSALISFLRTLVFQVSIILILPLLLELTGIWMSGVTAEILTLIVTVTCLVLNRKKYHYL